MKIFAFSNIKISGYYARFFSLLILGMSIAATSKAQQGNPLVLAEKYYARGDYYTAANLYEQYLAPGKKYIPGANFPLNAARNRKGGASIQMSRMEVLYKQAHSYRLAHYWPEAATRYEQLYEKDSTKYADALYWYAVCQRSMGAYALAESSLARYKANVHATESTKQAADKELKTIAFIKEQMKRPDSVMYQLSLLSTSFGYEKGVYAPAGAENNEWLITSTVLDTPAKLGTNPYHNRLFKANLENTVLQVKDPLNLPVNDLSMNQGVACLSPDGQTLYFTQWKWEDDKPFSAIYKSSKTGNGWSNPVLLPGINEEGYSSKQPFVTADGQRILFASNRPGGAGGFDIWMATLADGKATNITNAGDAINTEADEQAPFYHAQSNTLIFSSNGRIGMGGYDLYAASWKNGQWQEPQNMGRPFNSSRDDIYYYASPNGELMKQALFSSDRGSSCCLQTYTVTKLPKKKIIEGEVRDSKSNEPLAEAMVVMQDNKGHKVQAITNAEGKFAFEYTGDLAQTEFTITKEKYKDVAEPVKIKSTDETSWHTDYAYNVPILMEKKLVIRPETVVTVFFDFDKYDLKPRSLQVLDSIYTVLEQTPAATIQISGYTDGKGTEEYNKILSDKRARACAEYLIGKGIEASRITFESFGACCPVEMELINGRDNDGIKIFLITHTSGF
jgi:outer membrane protein OmpA-like peptidoglycan-associated protein